jgi:hypothetical protein
MFHDSNQHCVNDTALQFRWLFAERLQHQKLRKAVFSDQVIDEIPVSNHYAVGIIGTNGGLRPGPRVGIFHSRVPVIKISHSEFDFDMRKL